MKHLYSNFDLGNSLCTSRKNNASPLDRRQMESDAFSLRSGELWIAAHNALHLPPLIIPCLFLFLCHGQLSTFCELLCISLFSPWVVIFTELCMHRRIFNRPMALKTIPTETASPVLSVQLVSEDYILWLEFHNHCDFKAIRLVMLFPLS